MPKKETNKYFYIISVLVALLVIGITITASFAFFTNSGSPTGTATVITSGSMSLELVDGDVVGITQGMLPGQKVQKKFKVRNTGTLETKYDIYLSEILNDFADKSDLVYRLISEDGGYNSSSDREVPSSVGTSSKIVPGTSIGANEEHNYILEIEFLNKNENQDDNKGKKFSAKIQINDYKEYTFATLDTGSNVGTKLKKLANPNMEYPSSWSTDENVTSIQRANQLDGTKTTEIISNTESLKPVYAWYDNGILYYYTEANMIYLNDNSEGLFCNYKQVTSIDLSSFDSSKVTNMSWMFGGSSNLSNIDLTAFDVSNVTNMNMMFYDLRKLEVLDLSMWDTSSLENPSYMFSGSESGIKYINISGWDLTKVGNNPLKELFYERARGAETIIARNIKANITSMADAFSGCVNLVTVDLTGIDTSNVTSMEKTFQQCLKLKNIIGITEFDTSKVTEMRNMFYNCQELEVLDLSSFDTSKVNSISFLFSNCSSLRTIYVSDSWNLSSLSSTYSIFSSNLSIVGGAGTTFDSNHTDTSYAHVDEGPSNPGYFTYKANNNNNNNTSNQDPVISYKYWNDDFRSTNYTPTSVPTTVYDDYSNLISGSGPNAFVKTTYNNGNPSGHSTCLYYNNNVFCIDYNYWASIIGSTNMSDENGEIVKNELQSSMEAALGISADSCLSGMHYAICYFGSAQCYSNSYGRVACKDGSKGCYDDTIDSTYCD